MSDTILTAQEGSAQGLAAQAGAQEAAVRAVAQPAAAFDLNTPQPDARPMADAAVATQAAAHPKAQPAMSAPTAVVAPTAIPARRVGTITMGIALIATGIVLCLGMFWPSLDLLLVFRFAPLLLALLGVEVLVGYARAKTAPIKYDILSMLFCTAVIFFSAFVTCVAIAALSYNGFYDAAVFAIR